MGDRWEKEKGQMGVLLERRSNQMDEKERERNSYKEKGTERLRAR